jgi:hypothetical protein
MTQFGMQMPGGQQARRAQPDVYTGLMLVAFVALSAATAFVYLAGTRVGPDGNALALQQQNSVSLAEMTAP